MNHILGYQILLLFLGNCPLLAQISLTYTGNMGVLLESENHFILVDGLHEFYRPSYLNPSAQLVEDLTTAGGNYPIPEIALVTHYHRDHYSAKLHNKLSGTLVIGPAQVTDSLSHRDQQTIRTVPYTEYEIHHYMIEEVSIKAFRMDHVNRARHHKVQNVAYLMDLGGYSILHVGDTDWYEEIFENLELATSVDIAILPVWMLLQDQSQVMVRGYLNPQYLVVTHIDPHSAQETIKEVRKKFPESLILTQMGEAHTF